MTQFANIDFKMWELDFDLSYTQSLFQILDSNTVTGAIPTEIGAMTNLAFLIMSKYSKNLQYMFHGTTSITRLVL
jgi:hypothetical protein